MSAEVLRRDVEPNDAVGRQAPIHIEREEKMGTWEPYRTKYRVAAKALTTDRSITLVMEIPISRSNR